MLCVQPSNLLHQINFSLFHAFGGQEVFWKTERVRETVMGREREGGSQNHKSLDRLVNQFDQSRSQVLCLLIPRYCLYLAFGQPLLDLFTFTLFRHFPWIINYSFNYTEFTHNFPFRLGISLLFSASFSYKFSIPFWEKAFVRDSKILQNKHGKREFKVKQLISKCFVNGSDLIFIFSHKFLLFVFCFHFALPFFTQIIRDPLKKKKIIFYASTRLSELF